MARGVCAGKGSRARHGKASGRFRRPTVAALLFLRGRDADRWLRVLEARRARVRPVLGALAVRLTERRAWRPLGFRTLSDFARERLGVGARVVSEWARVWRALEELPLLRDAVLAGEVSWTVARLVVGVATPETEAACLETVRGRTVRAVEALVAAVRAADRGEGAAGAEGTGSGTEADEGVEAGDDVQERVGFRVACPLAVGGKWNAAVELARRMNGAQVPIWRCAESIAAEVVSALPPEPGARRGDAFGASVAASAPPAGAAASTAVSPPAGAPRSPRPWSRPLGARDLEPGLRALAFPHLPWSPLAPHLPPETGLEPGRLVEGLERCGSHELDRRLRAAVACLQSLDVELGRVLRQVVNRRLYREIGFETFEHFVRERLDTAPRTARRLARLARAEHRAPSLAAAFREGQVTAFQAEVLLGVIERGGPRRPRDLDTQLSDLDGLARLQDLASWKDSWTDAWTDSWKDAWTDAWKDRDRCPRGGSAGGEGSEAGAGLDSASLKSAGCRLRLDEVAEHWLALARRTTLRRLELEANAEPQAAVAFHGPPDVVAFFQSVLERVRRRLDRSANGSVNWSCNRSFNESVNESCSESCNGSCNGDGVEPGGDPQRARRKKSGAGAKLPPWAALEAMLDHVIVTWSKEEHAAARRQPRDYADFDRDGFRCTMPGCTARAELERHHVHFRSRGGPDVPENRTTLCWFHHHAAVHQRRARISGRAPDRLLFELGVRPDGPPLARYRSGDVALCPTTVSAPL